jgi:hypothetical protein
VSTERLAAPRLSIARRPLLDLPLTASGSGAGNTAANDGIGLPGAMADANAEFESSSTFDVPAFLRRQEG